MVQFGGVSYRVRVSSGSQLNQPLLDLIDGGIRGGCARRDSDRLCPFKPLLTQVMRPMHMMHPPTKTAACPNQFLRVIAGRSADDNPPFRLLGQFDSRVLALLRRLANGINEAHLGIGEAPAQQFHQPPHPLNRLRGLRCYAESSLLSQVENIRLREHYIKVAQVLRKAAQLDVVTLAYDDGVI